MLTIFHRYSKSTFTIFFSARVSDLHLFSRRISWSLVVSFVKYTSYCLFHHKHKASSFSLRPHTTSYMKTHVNFPSFMDTPNQPSSLSFQQEWPSCMFSLHLEIRDISLRPSHLLLHFPPRGSFFLNLSRQNYTST